MTAHPSFLQWIGDPQVNKWPGLEDKNFVFYNGVRFFKNHFEVNSAVKVPYNGFIKIVKILCLYEDLKSKNVNQRFRAVVEKFSTSEQIPRYPNSPELHPDFEVVQEDGACENISIDSFRKKCVVLFVPVTRCVEDVIEEFAHKFLDSVYICRYKMLESGVNVMFSEALPCKDESSESDVEEIPKRRHYRVMSLNCDNDQLKLKLKRKSLCSPEKIDLCTPMVLLEKLNLNDLKKSPVKRSLWTDPSKENDGNVINKSKRKQRFNHEMYKTEIADEVIDEIILEKKECPKVEIVVNDKNDDRLGRKQNFSRKMYDSDVIVDEIIISKNVEKSPERRNKKPAVKSPKRKLNNGVVLLDSDDSDIETTNKTPVKMKKTDESIDLLSCKLKSKLGIVTPKKLCDTPKSTPRRKRLTRLDESEEQPFVKSPKTKKTEDGDGEKSSRLRRSVRRISVTENEPVRRSTRMSLRNTPKKIIESSDDEDFKPKTHMSLRNTPKKIIELSDDDDFKPVNKILQTVTKTPSKPSPKKTPKLKISTLTPQVENRTTALTPSNNPFELARTQLTSELRPGCLPCREKEFDDIMTFLKGKLSDNSGGCMYISGVPGTGKTATVREIMKVLEKNKKKSRKDFKFLSVNALSLTEPRQVYVEIVKQLSDKTLRWDSALDHLRNFFLKQKHLLHVLLIDELDKLCTRKQDVVYNLLDLPSMSKTPLVVITIANTMDLPERLLSNKVNSRLGLTRLTFHPYKHKELVDIVKTRLKKHCGVFRSEALEFVARKVAAVSGDARRALAICGRATEIAEASGIKEITMDIVNKTLDDMASSPKVQAIKSCSKTEKMILQAITQEVTRTGNDEVSFSNIVQLIDGMCILNSVSLPSVTVLLSCCQRLNFFRLIIMQEGKYDVANMILLNVSADDVHFALKDE